MDTKALTLFSTVYESNSFSQAAAKVYMSPQGIAKMITKLENELNVQLFERTKQGIVPTKSAQRLYEKATDLRVIFQNITMTKSENNIHQEFVNLFIADEFSDYLGFDFFYDFQRRYSNKTLNFVEFPDSMLANAIIERGNIGFIEGPINFEKFNGFFVTENHYCTIMSPGHRLAGETAVQIRDLNKESLATKSKEFQIFNTHLTALVKQQVFPIHTLQTSNDDFIVEFARRNLGIGIVPEYLLELPHFKNLKANNEVIAKPLAGVDLKRDIYFVHVNDRQLSEGEQLFEAYVKGYVTNKK
ncbi:LysR family transcriptional regulator [Loigolactobacillus binensis]|uniref:LysR family transcriptional regulator n=1 Tax=Loigolactobacillus binensis TaxID=2559922 RepID=A0ABW3EAR5_9LACO|nr:LysR family transcriptional regulator [Loigolactobacillus binensis]